MSIESNPKLAAKSIGIPMNPDEYKPQTPTANWEPGSPAQVGRYPSCAICLEELNGEEVKTNESSVPHPCKFLRESHPACIMAHIIIDAKKQCDYIYSHPEEKERNRATGIRIRTQSTCPLCRGSFPVRYRYPMRLMDSLAADLLEIHRLHVPSSLCFFAESMQLLKEMPRFSHNLVVVFIILVDAIRKFPCNRDELTATCIFVRKYVFPPLRFSISYDEDPPCKRVGLKWQTLVIKCDAFKFIHIWFRPLIEFDLTQYPFTAEPNELLSVCTV